MPNDRYALLKHTLQRLEEQIASDSDDERFFELIEERCRVTVELAKLQRKPYCEAVALGVIAEPNVASPLVMSRGNALSLGFLICPWNPGQLVNELGLNVDEPLYAMVNMPQVTAWRVDAMGDDVQSQHPSMQVAGHGFSFAHIIRDSLWLTSCEKRVRGHIYRFKAKYDKHLHLRFHDDLVEVITRGWECEVLTNERDLMLSMTHWLAARP